MKVGIQESRCEALSVGDDDVGLAVAIHREDHLFEFRNFLSGKGSSEQC